jgi:ferric-dicitrate binding protein FerR (iron transport regulator)
MVWLNAASRITYPTAFTGSRREVTVSGEAYFEVATDKEKPFIVDVDGKSSIEVLGTSFNINSYADEGSIKTTLLAGSIKVSNNTTAVATSSDRQPGVPGMDVSSVILKPGQQALIPTTAPATSSDRRTSPQSKTGSDITLNSNVDIEQALAWKNGMFNFNGSDLKAVMRQLERWYGIEVKYAGPAPQIFFKGKMDRGVNLSDVLEFFTNMGVKYRLENKTLTVL